MKKALSTLTSIVALSATALMLTGCNWCCLDCSSGCCPKQSCCPQPRYCGDQPMNYCKPGYYQYFDAS